MEALVRTAVPRTSSCDLESLSPMSSALRPAIAHLYRACCTSIQSIPDQIRHEMVCDFEDAMSEGVDAARLDRVLVSGRCGRRSDAHDAIQWLRSGVPTVNRHGGDLGPSRAAS